MKVFDLLLVVLLGLCVAVWWVFLTGVEVQTKPEPLAPPTDFKAVSIQETVSTEALQPAMTVDEVQNASGL